MDDQDNGKNNLKTQNSFLNQNYFFIVYTCNSLKETVKILIIDGERKNFVLSFKYFKDFICNSGLNNDLINSVLNSFYEIGTFWILDRENQSLQKLKNLAFNDLNLIGKSITNLKTNFFENIKKNDLNFKINQNTFYTFKRFLDKDRFDFKLDFFVKPKKF